jgi:hypothetical protein
LRKGLTRRREGKEERGEVVSRGDAETRRVGDRVPQLPKALCGNEGVLECSGWTELWMGIERADRKIQSGVKPPQSKKEGSGISREDAKARRKGRRRFSVSSLAQVVQLPKTFFCNEGVLECSGLTELWMGIERVDGKIQSGVKPPQSKKPGSGLNFDSNFRFPHSPRPPSPRLSTPVSRPNRLISVIPQRR